ncbi:DMT family transporter [Aureimonas sp. OT7]|uniref:DMT family transporter n=1 Tax=Aureimonas sp. OT7 TaxID=2816454 RepID=UPI00177B1F0C|nr:DMT family transporter [Aureimonas sp. OT7]QOG06061.1 DMT family transporter [Aureimonas sp. OT7]
MVGDNLTALLAIMVAGILLAIQAPVNAGLSRGVGDPFLAAAISFAVGLVVLAAMVSLRQAWPSGLGVLGQLPWWSWTGGLLGAFYMAIVIWFVPRVGVLSMVGALALGQILAALLIDANGAFGLPMRELSMQRIGAALLILLGIVLSRAG